MRLKDVTEFCPAYSGEGRRDNVAFVPMEALRCDSITQQEIPFEEARGKYTFFADGDVLFAKVTPCFENGNIAVAVNLKGGIGFGSSEIFVLRTKLGLNNRYLFYVVQASPFVDGGCATMCGVGGLKRMSPLFPRTFEWEIPEEESQCQIVSYLDEKAAAIDARVAVLEKKLAAYKRLKKSVINQAVTRGLDPNAKLKDSGVDWIGQVPEGWKVLRAKDFGVVVRGVSYKPEDLRDEDDGVLLLRACNIEDGAVVYDDKVYVAAKCVALEKYLRKDDLLICATNGSLRLVGKAAIISAQQEQTFGAFMLVLRVACVPKFALYQLGVVVEYIRGTFTTTTINQLSTTQLETMRFCMPNPEVQQEIADYLDAECAKIDKAAEIVEKQIDAYKRLKRSLINEVVTGSRKVA